MSDACFIQALKRQPHDRTPVWLMRQAGRYLPEYRALREKVPNFLAFCKTPELCCEAVMQPLARFDLDAAILFSDILTVPAAMGLDLAFVAGEGPVFNNPVQDEKGIAALKAVDVPTDLGYVADAVSLIEKTLDGKVPLIGFSGSPWTVATYMVEGGSSKTFKTIKAMAYARPDLLQQLLQKVTDVTIEYLLMQIEAGCEVVQVFDTWGGVLPTQAYETFSLHYMQQIVSAVKTKHPNVPVILFTKGGAQWLEKMADTGCDAAGLDWTVELSDAFNRVGNQITLQGNLDPFTLYGSDQSIEKAVSHIMQQAKGRDNFVFNLGHGIDKDTPIGAVETMVNAIRNS